jgi:hypothetical protein
MGGERRPAPTGKELTMQANPIRRIGSRAEMSPRRMSEPIIAFTQHEGFPAHEAAVRIRLGGRG